MTKYKIGDRVIVSDDYFIRELRCRTGVVENAPSSLQNYIEPHRHMRTDKNSRLYWVNFDAQDSDEIEAIDGAEFSESALRKAK